MALEQEKQTKPDRVDRHWREQATDRLDVQPPRAAFSQKDHTSVNMFDGHILGGVKPRPPSEKENAAGAHPPDQGGI